MFAGIRPYVTTGVALVGAGVIAVTPVEPPSVAAPAMSPAVQLAAIPSPLQLYPQVFGTALQNAGALLGEYFADPFPIISATVENQASALADAAAALESGDGAAFFTAIADVVLEPFTSAGAALTHLDALLRQPFAIEGFFIVAISPVLSGITATAVAISDVVTAIATFDVVGFVNAVINIPARIVDGVLNGGYESPIGGLIDNLPGLLTPFDPESDLIPGPISVGITLDQDMGAAIPPRTSTTPVDELPDPDAVAVTLATDLTSKTAVAPEDSSAGDEDALDHSTPGDDDADVPETVDPTEEDGAAADEGDLAPEDLDELASEGDEGNASDSGDGDDRQSAEDSQSADTTGSTADGGGAGGEDSATRMPGAAAT